MMLKIKNKTNIPMIVKDEVISPEQVKEIFTAKVGYIEIKTESEEDKCLIHYDVYNRLEFYPEGDIKCVEVVDGFVAGTQIWILRPSYEKEKIEQQKQKDLEDKILKAEQNRQDKLAETKIEMTSETSPAEIVKLAEILEQTKEENMMELAEEQASRSRENLDKEIENLIEYVPPKEYKKSHKIIAGLVASLIPILLLLIVLGIIFSIPILTYVALGCLLVPVAIYGVYLLISTTYRLVIECLENK